MDARSLFRPDLDLLQPRLAPLQLRIRLCNRCVRRLLISHQLLQALAHASIHRLLLAQPVGDHRLELFALSNDPVLVVEAIEVAWRRLDAHAFRQKVRLDRVILQGIEHRLTNVRGRLGDFGNLMRIAAP